MADDGRRVLGLSGTEASLAPGCVPNRGQVTSAYTVSPPAVSGREMLRQMAADFLLGKLNQVFTDFKGEKFAGFWA